MGAWAAAGAGAAVAAVAVQAATALVPASWQRAGAARPARTRWLAYALVGGTAAALTGPWLVLVLIASGLIEMAIRTRPAPEPGRARANAWPLPLALAASVIAGGLLALAWVAFKVGALSYGGSSR